MMAGLLVKIALKLELFPIHCSDLSSVSKSVTKQSHKEVILANSTTNGHNITILKSNLPSTYLQVYYIAIYLVPWEFC